VMGRVFEAQADGIRLEWRAAVRRPIQITGGVCLQDCELFRSC
jgi:hypothetical protein